MRIFPFDDVLQFGARPLPSLPSTRNTDKNESNERMSRYFSLDIGNDPDEDPRTTVSNLFLPPPNFISIRRYVLERHLIRIRKKSESENKREMKGTDPTQPALDR